MVTHTHTAQWINVMTKIWRNETILYLCSQCESKMDIILSRFFLSILKIFRISKLVSVSTDFHFIPTNILWYDTKAFNSFTIKKICPWYTDNVDGWGQNLLHYVSIKWMRMRKKLKLFLTWFMSLHKAHPMCCYKKNDAFIGKTYAHVVN